MCRHDTASLFRSCVFNKLRRVSSGTVDVNGWAVGKGAGVGEGKREHGCAGLHCLEDHVINRCLEMYFVLILFN